MNNPEEVVGGRRQLQPWVIALVLYAVALVVRLGFIVESRPLPDFRTPTPGLDICVQWEGARQLRAGAPDPCLELMLPSAPFNVYLIAACQSVLGESMTAHRAFRALLGALSVVLVFLTGMQLTGRRAVSVVAACFVLALPSWVYFDTMLIKASPELMMLGATILLTLRLRAATRPRQFVVAGLLLGVLLSVLRFSQGATALYAVVISVYLLVRGRRNLRLHAVTVSLVLVLLLGTQLAWNFRKPLFGVSDKRFLPVSGVHMRVGFQEGAIGTYHVLQRFPALPLGHTFFARMAAEAKAGRQLTAKEANRTYIDEAREFIRGNPGEALHIVFRKLGLFFNNFEPAGNHYLDEIRLHTSFLSIPGIGFGGLVILAFWGAVALWRWKRFSELFLLTGLIVAVLIPNLLAFVTWRYRLHASLPLAVLAGVGLVYIWSAVAGLVGACAREPGGSRRYIGPAVSVAVTLCLAYIAFRGVLPNAKAGMFETAERNTGHSINREKYEEELAFIGTEHDLTELQMGHRSRLLHGCGRYTEAMLSLKQIVDTAPDEVPAARQYIVYLLWAGDYDAIVGVLKRLVATDPRSLEKLLRSFESDATFWDKADLNLKLIVQALMRDIVLPRLERELKGAGQAYCPAGGGPTISNNRMDSLS